VCRHRVLKSSLSFKQLLGSECRLQDLRRAIIDYFSVFTSFLSSMMTIDPALNSVLSVLALSDASKSAFAKRLWTCEALEDLFLDLAADKSKVEFTLGLDVDTNIVSDIDIRCIMFVFHWFTVKIFDPNFAWSTFTMSVYVTDKRARAVLKHAPYTPNPVASSTAPLSSTINFSTDVLAADAKRQATPAVPVTVAVVVIIRSEESEETGR
jgi:hypothetical protein